MRLLMGITTLVLLGACDRQQVAEMEATDSNSSQSPNILIIVADDLGVDSIPVFGQHPRNAATPNLDSLAARGMRFTQFWAQPTCSPTRVTALTGRYPFRHGVNGPLWDQSAHLGVPMPAPPAGSPLEYDHNPFGPLVPGQASRGPNTSDPAPGAAPPGPRPDELFLPAALQDLEQPYATAAFGKWHMADRENGWLNHPNLVGFDHYSGTLAGAIPSFFAWQHIENGEPSQESGYIDQRAVDDAVSWINDRSVNQPWFVWFSFVNPHEPFHKPPAELIHSPELKALDPQGINADNVVSYFTAQVEAMDSLVGQLVDGIPAEQRENTYIIWLGDNGDDVWARAPEERIPNRFKMTVYEGGIKVPAIVAGPGVAPNSENDSLTHVVDLFATAIALAGGDVASVASNRVIDSESFAAQLVANASAPQREWNFTHFNALGRHQKTIRNAEYKLISMDDGEQLYQLTVDPGERDNLIDSEDPTDQQNYLELRAQLDSILAESE